MLIYYKFHNAGVLKHRFLNLCKYVHYLTICCNFSEIVAFLPDGNI